MVEKFSGGVGLNLLWGSRLLQGLVGQAVPAARRCVAEPEALAFGLEGMAAVREAIEGGSGEPLAAEHIGPLASATLQQADRGDLLAGLPW